MSDSTQLYPDELNEIEDQLEQDRRNLELDDLKRVLSTKEGRRVFWRYIGVGNIFATSYRGENTHETSYQEGIKQISRLMIKDIDEASPDAYFKMRQEAMEMEQTRKQIRKNMENKYGKEL